MCILLLLVDYSINLNVGEWRITFMSRLMSDVAFKCRDRITLIGETFIMIYKELN